LKEIGKIFGIRGYSTVNSTVQRVKVGMERDELLLKRIDNLISILSKSQEQI
jgi:chromosomal replication initiation ATPase DnaA